MRPIDPTASTARPAEKAPHCPRLGAPRTVAEHLDCPYCHGRAADVEGGDRACFCDYDPKRDPVVYGFPPGTIRQGG